MIKVPWPNQIWSSYPSVTAPISACVCVCVGVYELLSARVQASEGNRSLIRDTATEGKDAELASVPPAFDIFVLWLY